MKAVLLYFRETKFENNKFKLDFSDHNQIANSVELEKNTPYLIATLNCNLKPETTNTIKITKIKTKNATDKKQFLTCQLKAEFY